MIQKVGGQTCQAERLKPERAGVDPSYQQARLGKAVSSLSGVRGRTPKKIDY